MDMNLKMSGDDVRDIEWTIQEDIINMAEELGETAEDKWKEDLLGSGSVSSDVDSGKQIGNLEADMSGTFLFRANVRTDNRGNDHCKNHSDYDEIQSEHGEIGGMSKESGRCVLVTSGRREQTDERGGVCNRLFDQPSCTEKESWMSVNREVRRFANSVRISACQDTVSVPTCQDTVSIPTCQDTVSIPTCQDTVSIPACQNTVSVPACQDTVSVPACQDTVSIPTCQDTVSIPACQDTVSVPACQDTVSISTCQDIGGKLKGQDDACIPTCHYNAGIPTCEDGAGIPTCEDNAGTPTCQNGAGTPTCEDNAGTPTCEDNAGTPTCQDGAGTPTCEDGAGIPTCEDGTGIPVCVDNAGTPTCEDGAGPPTCQDSAGIPTCEDGAGTPTCQDNAGTPTCEDGAGTPVCVEDTVVLPVSVPVSVPICLDAVSSGPPTTVEGPLGQAVSVRASSHRAKKKKLKQKAKLERLLAKYGGASDGTHKKYATSFQELLPAPEDDFHSDFLCAVCLQLFHRPHVVTPCGHVFCEPCLRKLPSSALGDKTVCPLCRHDIQACILDRDLHAQLSSYYAAIYRQRARQERRFRKNHNPLPRTRPTPLSQTLLRQIFRRGQSQRGTPWASSLHLCLSVCMSGCLSVLFARLNIPVEIGAGRLHGAAVSNIWVQTICLFLLLTWLFVKFCRTFASDRGWS